MIKPSEMVARLKSADWLNRDETQALLRLLGGEAGQTRAVGGIVRDTLLGRELARTDVDFATALLPHEVAMAR